MRTARHDVPGSGLDADYMLAQAHASLLANAVQMLDFHVLDATSLRKLLSVSR